MMDESLIFTDLHWWVLWSSFKQKLWWTV